MQSTSFPARTAVSVAAVNKLDQLLHLLYCRKYLSFLPVTDFLFQSVFLITVFPFKLEKFFKV